MFPPDNVGLRKFADYLRQCEAAKRDIRSLSVLDDDLENRKMLENLPNRLVTRWGQKVVDVQEADNRYPRFSEFVTYVT